jgi:hypothetical protein
MRHAPFAVYLLRLTIHFRTHIQAHIFFTIGKMAELGKALKNISFSGFAHNFNVNFGVMAERQGFEPWEPVKAQRFSRPPRSTTPAPLRGGLVEERLRLNAAQCKGDFQLLFRMAFFHCFGTVFA